VDRERLLPVHLAYYTDRVFHCPVPVSAICVWAGVAPPPTLIVREAVLVVAVVGRNVVLIVQLAPTANVDGKGRNTLPPHVFVCANRLDPVMDTFVMGKGTVPVFVTVAVCIALVVLIA